ncbi:MAG: hypothetical protein Q9203_002491 [Teloschistes exilis]
MQRLPSVRILQPLKWLARGTLFHANAAINTKTSTDAFAGHNLMSTNARPKTDKEIQMLLLALNSTAATPQYVSVSAFDCYFPATDFEYHITAAIGVTLADPDNQDVCKAVSGQRSGGMIGPMNTEAYRA